MPDDKLSAIPDRRMAEKPTDIQRDILEGPLDDRELIFSDILHRHGQLGSLAVKTDRIKRLRERGLIALERSEAGIGYYAMIDKDWLTLW
ncbi:hypothetical protein [Rhizobium sp. WYJ-E13]|uniref:hypothetical protein n=1 Tax=Rhizobium sp. WYJ-E13 TaxID=2849093 RepID=UPI001C1EE6DF|nr:hypothetical protein [Rhizobium sp. WYJ-E13]QWW70104.1 hypothetical protein KQ933_10595 [Rhizobium sp. WYJ-E13]